LNTTGTELPLLDRPATSCLGACRLFDHIGDAVLVVELPSTRIAMWKGAASAIFGYSEAETIGLHLTDLVPELAVDSLAKSHAPVQLRGRHKEGQDIALEATFGLLESTGLRGTIILAMFRDVSARASTEAALADRALHDQLTGLPNRWLLEDRFNQLLRSTRRNRSSFVVLMLDLDGFKTINDELGHLAGDAVLQEVARRLCAAVREADTVARVGGDEFVLLVGLDRHEGVRPIAQRLGQALVPPMTVHGRAVNLRASIGAAVYQRDGSAMATLFGAADQAMYRAKRAGGGYRLAGEKREFARLPELVAVRD